MDVQPITISEFRKNTKVMLDIANLKSLYIMRGIELFELRRVGWERPNEDAIAISRAMSSATNTDGFMKAGSKFLSGHRQVMARGSDELIYTDDGNQE